MSFGLLEQALRTLKAETPSLSFVQQRTPKRVNRWFKWLAPGLLVKRWLLISLGGVLLTALGIAIWVGLTPIYRLMEFASGLLIMLAQVFPSYISGPLAIAGGLFLLFWGQTRTLGSIAEALQPEGDEELVDVLMAHRRLHRGPKIVVLGGGTGLSTLLRGLKTYSANITAVVTVADDGGSSGRLRRELGTIPPGDIRNCVAALADEEKLLTELFQYRFSAGSGLSGHSFGNLFLTAMSDITGDFERAIAASSKVLAVRGRVLPATLSDVRLWAEMEDGRFIEGESNIPEAKGKIARIGCIPENPPALPAALKAIEEADFIVLGPGSLYTSVIPNLLVPEIRNAIARSRVPRIYVCNIMTQPGETEGYSVCDHIRAIDRVWDRPHVSNIMTQPGETEGYSVWDRSNEAPSPPPRLFDAVVVHGRVPSANTLIRYAQENSHPVFLDREAVINSGRRVILANIMHEDPETGYVRHDSPRLARVLLRWYASARGK